MSPAAFVLGLALVSTAHPAAASPLRYEIRGRLDESASTLTATERIHFTNQTCEPLTSLTLILRPNAFSTPTSNLSRELAAQGDFSFSWATSDELGWLRVDHLSCNRTALAWDDTKQETELCVTLADRLLPGDSAVLALDFELKVPAFFSPELGRKGRCYLFSAWYPRLAPATPGLADVADYDVELTLTEDLIVAASGSMVDPDEEERQMVWPPEFRGQSRSRAKTLHFTGQGLADFAWAASPDLVLTRIASGSTAVRILARQANRLAWTHIPGQVKAILDRYCQWYGECPHPVVTVVDAIGIAPADLVCPGLVVVSQQPLPFTRVIERALCRNLALLWFPTPATGPKWFGTGAAVYSEVRYLEESYGPTNLLDLPFDVAPLEGLGDAYLHRLLYYVAASNHQLRTLSGPTRTDPTSGFTIHEADNSQAGGLFLMLARLMGEPGLDQALREYRQHGVRADSASDGFAATCSRIAGQDLSWFFDRWLDSDRTCDYAVIGARRTDDSIEVGIRQVGDIPMPVDVEFAFTDGSTERREWSSTARSGVIRLSTPKRLRRVTLDPDNALLESNRWNNHWPPRVEVKPLLGLPSLDAYEIFYGPYVWYDNYNGVRLGAWAHGHEFIDAGPLRGRHMWFLSETYSTRIQDWQTSGLYQTPLRFVSDRLRFTLQAKYSLIAAGASAGLIQELGRVFRKPNATIELSYRLSDLYNLRLRDTRAWDLARTAELRLRANHYFETRRFNSGQRFYLGRGLPWLGGQPGYDYWKASVEQVHEFRLDRKHSVVLRGFGGAIWGGIPNQDQFYLCGGLTPTSAEPVSWGHLGMSSSQDHWHYDADANLRGYAGQYLHGRFAYGLNLHLVLLPFLHLFFDVGNFADSLSEPEFLNPRMDAGVRLKLGPLYADIPVWRYQVGGRHRFEPNWMLGLKLSWLNAGF